MDEAEIAKQKYNNVLVGSSDAPNQTIFVDCHSLKSGNNVNSSIILQLLEIKRENFSLLSIDAARCMSLAEKTLKKLYSSMMHVICIAHLLHNCTMHVPALFKNIDEVIATIKEATIKTKYYEKDFHDAGLPSPPDSVITRWATLLKATLYYSENFLAVRTIINNCTSAGLLLNRAKDAVNVEDLVPNLVKINQYGTLAANAEFLEGSACTIAEAYGLLKNMQFGDDSSQFKITLKNDDPTLI